MANDDEQCEKYGKEFSDRLRFLRNRKKISAREMSLALGQNVNYINLIENGRRFPSLQGFFSICDCLDISPADFFTVSEDAGTSENEILPAVKTELYQVMSKLTEKQTDSILKMILSLQNHT
ncbi:helix-turn-helix domain-containing protein [Treponema sp.]|uniref:helix-turn-helix domain-containing protein n=1 Tax=Treponema sp. TaxID=166 RepID=UPI003F128FD5